MTPDLFSNYLRCDLPHGYTINNVPLLQQMGSDQFDKFIAQPSSFMSFAANVVRSVPLSQHMSVDLLRELIFQQSRILKFASSRQLPEWIKYFTVIKHEKLMNVLAITTGSFREFADKQFFEQCSTEYSSFKQNLDLDVETKHFADRLLLLQSCYTHLTNSEEILVGAIRAGFDSLAPAEKAPVIPASHALPTFFLISVGGWIYGAIHYETMAKTVAATVIIGAIVGVVIYGLEQDKIKRAAKRFERHRLENAYYQRLKEELPKIPLLAPTEYEAIMTDLPSWLEYIKALKSERATAESEFAELS